MVLTDVSDNNLCVDTTSRTEASLELKWWRGTDMPFEMYGYLQVAVLKEKVYIGGGMASSEEQTVIVYDPHHDSYIQN